MKPKTLRLSYTLLNLWESNQINEAIAYYQHKSTLFTEAIQDGRIYDQVWQEEIDTKKELHIGRTVIKFKAPKTQVKVEVDWLDRFQIVGVYDILDLDVLYELKSGVTSSLEYSDSPQVKMYFFIAGLKGIPIKTSRIIRYNQYKDEADITIFHNSKQQIEEAENYCQTLGGEIWEHFNKIGII